jgi:hypothetical protein
LTEKETKEILDILIDEGTIEESPLSPNYYVNKSK